jgi:hypothetical protein
MRLSRSLAVLAVAGAIALGGPMTRQLDFAPSTALARESQAVPGVFNSSLTLQNPTGTDAIAAVNFIGGNGAPALANPLSVVVPGNGSALVYVPNVVGLADGRYSAVVDSTVPLYMIANLVSAGPTTSASYNGFTAADAGTSFYVPSVYKSYVGLYTSTITVQNSDQTTAAAVTVTYKDGNGNDAGSERATIPPNASVTFDQANASALPAGFVGSAVVTSDRGVGATFAVSDPINQQFSSSNGFKDGATIAYLPVLYNAYSTDQWITSFLIQNVDTTDAEIQVSYSDGRTATATIRPGASRLYYQGNDGTPLGAAGSAVVTSTNGKKVVAIANIRNQAGNLSAYNGFTDGTKAVNLPVIYNNYSSLGWTTSFTIQNVDTVPTNLTVTFSDGTTVRRNNVLPGRSELFYQPNDGVPNGFNGGVSVASSQAKVVGVVNELSLARPNPGDWLLTYNGFNR